MEKLPGTWTELRALSDRESELSLSRCRGLCQAPRDHTETRGRPGPDIVSALVTLRISTITHGGAHWEFAVSDHLVAGGPTESRTTTTMPRVVTGCRCAGGSAFGCCPDRPARTAARPSSSSGTRTVV